MVALSDAYLVRASSLCKRFGVAYATEDAEWIFRDDAIDPGYHEVKFDGSWPASGVHFYRIQVGSFVETKKLLLVNGADPPSNETRKAIH